MTRWRTRRRGTDPDRGAAAVEFAIVLVVLLLIIFAIIDFGRLLYVVQGMKAASREGARTASVRGTVWGPATTTGTVTKAVTDAGSAAVNLAAGNPRYLTITAKVNDTPIASPANGTTLCSATTVGQPVEITTQTGFKWFTPTMSLLGVAIGPFNVPSVSASSTMRCE